MFSYLKQFDLLVADMTPFAVLTNALTIRTNQLYISERDMRLYI